MSRRRHSGTHIVALAIAVFAALPVVVIASAGAASQNDRVAPRMSEVPAVAVTSATQSTIELSWPAARDNKAVTGYGMYIDDRLESTVTRFDPTAETVGGILSGLRCGTSYRASIDAVDDAENRSERVSLIVSTAACADTSPPSTPTGFRQAATTETSAVVTWSPSSDNTDVVGYDVFVAGLKVSTTSDASATLDNLRCGTQYVLEVAAFDAAGNRSARSTMLVATSPCPQTKPWTSSLVDGAVIASGTKWTVTFQSTPESVDFWASGSMIKVDTTPPFDVALNLPAGEHRLGFCYRTGGQQVCAGQERQGVVHVVTVQPATPPPPGEWTSSLTDGAVVAPGTVWRIAFATAPDAVDFWASGSKIATDTATPFEARLDLAAGQHKIGFCYRSGSRQTCASPERDGVVHTITVVAPSSPSGEAPSSPSGDTTPPTVPESVRATAAASTSVTIAWTGSSDNVGVAGYGLYRGTSRVATTAQTTHTYDGLTCGTAYQVGVDSYDAAGNRSQRTDLMVTTAPCADRQSPSAPSSVVATTRTATSIALAWSPSTDNVGVVGYGLYRAGALVGTASGTTGIVSGLTCGTNYTLAVDAYDAAGNRSPQTVVMVSTTACGDTQPPSTPANLVASGITQTGLTLTWTASTDNVGVTGYDVFRNGTRLGSTTSTSSPQAGLTCATTYSFAVAAFDAAGNRSTQATVSARTAACATTGTGQVYVAPNGSDATCVRGDATKPCATFDRAYGVAQLGDVVEVAGGTYPFQVITQKPGKDTEGDAPDVTFRPAAGASVKVNGLELGGLCMCDDPSQFTGPDHITLKDISDARSPQGAWRAGQDTNDVTWDNIDAANFYLEGVRDFRVQGGDWGPCYVDQGAPCSNSKITFSPSYRTERVTIEGATFHDYRTNIGSSSHFECMFIVGGVDITVRRSKFYGCEFFDIFVQYFNDLNFPHLPYNPLRGLTIENNWFAQPYDGQGNLRGTPVWFSDKWHYGLEDVLVRYNTLYGGYVGFCGDSGGDCTDGGVPVRMSNVRSVGNLQSAAWASCEAGVTHRSNVYVTGSGSRQSCDASDRQLGSWSLVRASAGSDLDYHLTGGGAVNAVTTTIGDAMVSNDYDGQARPAGGVRDAGADEAG
jgi:chitodextrinase